MLGTYPTHTEYTYGGRRTGLWSDGPPTAEEAAIVQADLVVKATSRYGLALVDQLPNVPLVIERTDA